MKPFILIFFIYTKLKFNLKKKFKLNLTEINVMLILARDGKFVDPPH